MAALSAMQRTRTEAWSAYVLSKLSTASSDSQRVMSGPPRSTKTRSWFVALPAPVVMVTLASRYTGKTILPALPCATMPADEPAALRLDPSVTISGLFVVSNASRHHAQRFGCMTTAVAGKNLVVWTAVAAAMTLL